MSQASGGTHSGVPVAPVLIILYLSIKVWVNYCRQKSKRKSKQKN